MKNLFLIKVFLKKSNEEENFMETRSGCIKVFLFTNIIFMLSWQTKMMITDSTR